MVPFFARLTLELVQCHTRLHLILDVAWLRVNVNLVAVTDVSALWIWFPEGPPSFLPLSTIYRTVRYLLDLAWLPG